MKKIIVLVIIIATIILFWSYGRNTPPMGTIPEEGAPFPFPVATSTNSAAEGTITTPAAPTTTVKEFIMLGSNFSFTPNTLEVKQGDGVKITFKNADGFHNFTIDELAVAAQQIKSGQSETVEFMADKTGVFEYYCSVGNHRAMGMKGTLTVK